MHFRCQIVRSLVPASRDRDIESALQRLSEGEYSIIAYLFDENGVHAYDHRQYPRNLLVVEKQNLPGIVRLHHSFSLESLEPLPDDT